MHFFDGQYVCYVDKKKIHLLYSTIKVRVEILLGFEDCQLTGLDLSGHCKDISKKSVHEWHCKWYWTPMANDSYLVLSFTTQAVSNFHFFFHLMRKIDNLETESTKILEAREPAEANQVEVI